MLIRIIWGVLQILMLDVHPLRDSDLNGLRYGLGITIFLKAPQIILGTNSNVLTSLILVSLKNKCDQRTIQFTKGKRTLLISFICLLC